MDADAAWFNVGQLTYASFHLYTLMSSKLMNERELGLYVSASLFPSETGSHVNHLRFQRDLDENS